MREIRHHPGQAVVLETEGEPTISTTAAVALSGERANAPTPFRLMKLQLHRHG
jgi:hypothetical protein